MKFDPQKHPFDGAQGRHRRSIRLQGFDYSKPGGYFVTLVAQGRECLFGEVGNGEMQLNEYGRIVAEEWEKSAEIRREVELGMYVVMPNHMHAIVMIHDVGATGLRSIPAGGGRPYIQTGQGRNLWGHCWRDLRRLQQNALILFATRLARLSGKEIITSTSSATMMTPIAFTPTSNPTPLCGMTMPKTPRINDKRPAEPACGA